MAVDWSSIAQAASGLVGTVTNAVVTNRQNRLNRQFQLDMWNMQNAYNTPQQQMQRLQAAGLNPNLVYGQGASGVAGQANNAPVGAFGGYTVGQDLQTALSGAIDTYYKAKLTESQIAKNQAATDKENAQKEGIILDNFRKNTLNNMGYIDELFYNMAYGNLNKHAKYFDFRPQELALLQGREAGIRLDNQLKFGTLAPRIDAATTDAAVKRYNYEQILPQKLALLQMQWQLAKDKHDLFPLNYQNLSLKNKQLRNQNAMFPLKLLNETLNVRNNAFKSYYMLPLEFNLKNQEMYGKKLENDLYSKFGVRTVTRNPKTGMYDGFGSSFLYNDWKDAPKFNEKYKRNPWTGKYHK